jgi:hypothetical protein
LRRLDCVRAELGERATDVRQWHTTVAKARYRLQDNSLAGQIAPASG